MPAYCTRHATWCGSRPSRSFFYAAYTYFAKVRLVPEKHRSRHREAMEVPWEENRGHDRITDEKR